jgi:DNA-binding NtrC family response regulator
MSGARVVLIVDDDPAVLETMRILLEGKGGFEVFCALGSHGARHLMDRIERLDVLIADVILAGEATGIDMCHEAVSRHPHVALVVISADPRADAATIPEDSVYLRKPFGGYELLTAIDEAEHLAQGRRTDAATR